MLSGNEIFQLFGFPQNLWKNIQSVLFANGVSESTDRTVLVAWLLLATIIFVAKGYGSEGNFFSSSYFRVPTEADSDSPKSRYSAPQRTFSYPDTLEYNYFDPDNLPPLVQGYADYIFSSVQSLSAEIGFQVFSLSN